jgi:Na+-transporting methylmalonyl-CoA/oxaloacetate decarboxylase gamma subunit
MILFGDNTPMPTPTSTVPPEVVTPGFAGFAVVIVIVAFVILLIWDMNRRIRRVRYREEVREELDAELAAADESDADVHDDAPTDTDGGDAKG